MNDPFCAQVNMMISEGFDEESSIVTIDGSITGYPEEGDPEDPGDPQLLGTFTAHLVSLDHSIETIMYDAEDDNERQVVDFLLEVMDQDGEYKKFVQRVFPDLFPDKVLYVSRMSVAAPYNGHGLGLIAFDKLIHIYVPCGSLVACLPCPCEPEGLDDKAVKSLIKKYEIEKGHPAKAARKKLQDYWKRLGLKSIGKTGYLGFCTSNVRPKISDVLADLEHKNWTA